MIKSSVLIISQFFLTAFTFCQSTTSSEKDQINKVLSDFMESIQTKDSVKFYSLFHESPVAWIGTVKGKTYQDDLKRNPKAKNYFTGSYKGFFRSILDPNRYEEKFYNTEITEDGHMATVMFDYSFWENDKKINWGKESWGLIKSNTGWKICSVIFSVEYENLNPEYASHDKYIAASRLVRQMAHQLIRVAHLPGLSIAIRKKDEIVFAEGFGYADVEKKIPVTANTQFRAASTSKVITVTGLAKMIQDGIINIDAEVQKYLPFYPKKEYPITLKQLAGNVSGMPHYLASDKLENKFYSNTKDALTVFSHHKLLFKPQTKYSYSSAGFVLLSAAMEAASGIYFPNYLQDKVFNPFGMKSTEPDMGKYKWMPNLTTYYEQKNDGLVAVKDPLDLSSIWAAGGFVTTPTDLVNMTKAYADGYLTRGTVNKMFESQTLLSGEKTNVGIGWRIGLDMAGRHIIEHAGVTEGTRTVISYFPDEDLAISVMTNTEWVSSIEETAHMFALPFLTNRNDSFTHTGNYSIKAKLVQKGNEKEVKGKFEIEKGVGNIRLEGNIQYPVFHIIETTYALINHQGIYHLDIHDVRNRIVSGKAIMYKTPMVELPINIKPFFTFSSE
jgi:CubicO group peptidase (beta-lactamase class C family)